MFIFTKKLKKIQDFSKNWGCLNRITFNKNYLYKKLVLIKKGLFK